MKAITRSTWAIALLIMAGCSGEVDNHPATVDAKGVLTLDGKAYEGASIVCIPESGKHGCFAASKSDGSFALTAFENKGGAVPDSYKVQVTKTIEISGRAPTAEELGEDAEHMSEEEKKGVRWKNDLPKKYSSPTTSEIVIVVPEEGTTDLKIELLSK